MAEWLPELNRCWYVNRVVAVKRRFGLSMDAREAEAAQEGDPLALYDDNGNRRITCARRAGTGSRRCTVIIRRMRLCTMGTGMGWCVSRCEL